MHRFLVAQALEIGPVRIGCEEGRCARVEVFERYPIGVLTRGAQRLGACWSRCLLHARCLSSTLIHKPQESCSELTQTSSVCWSSELLEVNLLE